MPPSDRSWELQTTCENADTDGQFCRSLSQIYNFIPENSAEAVI